jgi:hypothetical protein
VADNLEFEDLNEQQLQELDLFKQELTEISEQFTPISKATFKQDEFKFAMVEVKNATPNNIEKTLIIALVKHTFNEQFQGEVPEMNYSYLPFQYVLDLIVELAMLIENHNQNFFAKLQEIVLLNRDFVAEQEQEHE